MSIDLVEELGKKAAKHNEEADKRNRIIKIMFKIAWIENKLDTCLDITNNSI